MMIRPLTHDSAPRLMEEEGIGYYFAVQQQGDPPLAPADAGKNEVSIETLVARHETAAAVYQHNQTDLECLLAGTGSVPPARAGS